MVNSQQAAPSRDKWKPANNNPSEKKLVKASPPIPVEDKPVAISNKPVLAQKQPVENLPKSPSTVINKETTNNEQPSQKVLVKEMPATIKKPAIVLAPPPAA